MHLWCCTRMMMPLTRSMWMQTVVLPQPQSASTSTASPMPPPPPQKRRISILQCALLIVVPLVTMAGQVRIAAFASQVMQDDTATETPTQQQQPRVDAISEELRVIVPAKDDHWNICTTKIDVIDKVSFARLYQCTGSKYERFGEKFQALIRARGQRDSDWGRRKLPIGKPNATVVVLGNSHMRQVLVQLVGQYAQSRISAKTLPPPPDCKSSKPMPCGQYAEITFRDNGSRIVAIINSPIVYASDWQARLRQWVPSWQDVDAIVLGRFNTVGESKGTSFERAMLELSQHMDGVDFTRIPPPRLEHFVRLYDGPILFLSMFSRYNQRGFLRQMKGMQTQLQQSPADQRRSNIAFLNARRYMEELGECSSIDRLGERQLPSTCGTAPKGHTCTGTLGSHADLAVWDVVEELYRLLR